MNYKFIIMQILKNTVRLQIERAALHLFAAQGYDRTTMAEIATMAGVSTGNLYRYHNTKEELLYTLIPASFVEGCLLTLQQKIDLVKGMSSAQIAASKEFKKGNLAFLKFLLDNRQKLLILMRGCSSTKWADFRKTAQQTVIDKVIEHVASLQTRSNTLPDHVLLTGIYENLISITVSILASGSSRKDCRKALVGLMSYHQRGLSAFC